MAINFSKIPAFGYEYITMRAEAAERKLALKESSQPTDDVLSINLKACRVFHQYNRNKALGYIPVVGTFIGINRLVTIHKDKEENISRNGILRGIIESLSLGILLMPIDLLVTFHRMLWADPEEISSSLLMAISLKGKITNMVGMVSGFKLLRGFELKGRPDSYMTADRIGRSNEIDLAKAELEAVLSDRDFNPDLIPPYLQQAASEYKIHLMPKAECSDQVLSTVLNHFRQNPHLKDYLAQYKVLFKDPATQDFLTTSGDRIPPRIVLYAESKEAAQAILDAMLQIFPQDVAEELGCDLTPTFNVHVNPLVNYAQGTTSIKKKAVDRKVDTFLEPDHIHFKGDYHLVIPAS